MRNLHIQLDKTLPGHTPKKFTCPACQKKRFVKYFNTETNDYLDDKYGRCDREEHCGYFSSPYSDLSDEDQAEFRLRVSTPPPPIKIKFVDKAILKQSLTAYDQNPFVQFLIRKFGEYVAMKLVYQFFIGTAKNNGTVFWQLDQFLRPRMATKIHYDQTAHRIKSTEPKKLFLISEDYRSCFFGEHQLHTGPANALVAIVESEKSATLATMFMPYLGIRPIVWLASSGVNGLTEEKIQCLRGRDILLVPDFSFHARATWGQVPMRKKYHPKEINGEVKQILKIDPDGDLVNDYVSAKDKLESIECSVKFFDPAPDTTDGSDIADIFAELPAPVVYEMPDFSQFELTGNTRSDLKRFDELKAKTDKVALLTERSFQIDDLNAEILTVSITPPHLKPMMEEILNKPDIRKFIKLFDLCPEGTVGPLK